VHLGEAFKDEAVEAYYGAVNAASRRIKSTVNAIKRAEHAVEQSAERVCHDVVGGYYAARDGVSSGFSGAVNAGSRAVDGTGKFAKPESHLSIDHPGHLDYMLFQQTLGAVHRLDAQNGRMPDHQSANLAAGVTVGAKAQGLTKADHVMLSEDGSKAFAVEGDLRSSFRQVANGIDTAHSVNTPVEHHTQALQQVHQAQVQQQVRPIFRA
jgi:hypothetical protein